MNFTKFRKNQAKNSIKYVEFMRKVIEVEYLSNASEKSVESTRWTISTYSLVFVSGSVNEV